MTMSLVRLPLAAAMSTLVATSAMAEAPRPPAEVFASLGTDYTDYLVDTGYIDDLDVYFAYYCASQANGGVGLVRYVNGEPRAHMFETGCVKNVDTVDLNKDGEPEIRFIKISAGSGFLGIIEAYLAWPTGSAEPTEGFEYKTFSYSTANFLFSGYDYEYGDFDLSIETTGEVLPGAQCGMGEYCPEWPEDAECRKTIICPIVEQAVLCVNDCDGPMPKNLAQDAEWKRFFAAVQADHGYSLGNAGAPPALTSLVVGDLADLDTGEVPPISAEKQAEIDDWLN
ncbi:hypothetical protein [Pseudooceanicola sp. LIPI14-2-Ac024]|uniref:hypothetical protein n=1 Tax=Pseudooceanicola sp. LIPI14-2-Ac024 TaxID=3344875 RepID=UPI0035D12D4B